MLRSVTSKLFVNQNLTGRLNFDLVLPNPRNRVPSCYRRDRDRSTTSSEDNRAGSTGVCAEYKSTLTLDLINHLERTSLVEFGNEEALTRLTEAIELANVLFQVDTTGVEPMTSVLDDSSLRLRDDTVVKTNRDDVLVNAAVTDEDYFVSPPGNIALTPKTAIDLHLQNKASQSSSN